MNRIFVIGDTHFGHQKCADARGFASVGEHDEALIENWNRAVKKDDTVIHLGDVLFGSKFEPLPRLNGIKKLVMGNHDRYRSIYYLEWFRGIYGSLEVKNYILTHIPVHPSQFMRFKGNIHGHLHSTSLDYIDRRYFCASAERINLTPIPISEVIERMERV